MERGCNFARPVGPQLEIRRAGILGERQQGLGEEAASPFHVTYRNLGRVRTN